MLEDNGQALSWKLSRQLQGCRHHGSLRCAGSEERRKRLDRSSDQSFEPVILGVRTASGQTDRPLHHASLEGAHASSKGVRIDRPTLEPGLDEHWPAVEIVQ